jgi:hypothetical protein
LGKKYDCKNSTGIIIYIHDCKNVKIKNIKAISLVVGMVKLDGTYIPDTLHNINL